MIFVYVREVGEEMFLASKTRRLVACLLSTLTLALMMGFRRSLTSAVLLSTFALALVVRVAGLDVSGVQISPVSIVVFLIINLSIAGIDFLATLAFALVVWVTGFNISGVEIGPVRIIIFLVIASVDLLTALALTFVVGLREGVAGTVLLAAFAFAWLEVS
jgi:hypothetical protein